MPNRAAMAVRIRIAPTVCSGDSRAGAPTRRMSAKASRRSGPRKVSRILARGDRRMIRKAAVESSAVVAWPSATPIRPSAGAGPQPKQSEPPITTWSAAPPTITTEGRAMSPEARRTEAMTLSSQIATATENTTPA